MQILPARACFKARDSGRRTGQPDNFVAEQTCRDEFAVSVPALSHRTSAAQLNLSGEMVFRAGFFFACRRNWRCSAVSAQQDYLHLQQSSCVVNAGQAVSYGTDLAKVGRSGTGGPHLYQAVTNLGEHTTDRAHFVTIAFPFCNYEYSDDSGATWHHAIRGYLKKDQWVRSPAPKSPVRYTAAWTPNTTGEYHTYDVPYATYRARYDVLWPQGWRLHTLSSVVVNGVSLYTAVWRPGTGGEFQIYDVPYAQYRARYDELWPQGWRLKLLTRYVIGGQIRYTAAWVPGTGGEFQIYDATYVQDRARYDGSGRRAGG
jgi:predicted Rdx family selenoprotein